MNETWKSEFVTLANGQKLHVRQTGGDLPAIFLIHGVTDSGRYWSRLAAALENEFNVFMPDMIGHGKSDPLNGVVTLTEMADHLIELLDHYQIESCQLCGHSMGGGIATIVAATQPERITAVIFEDPAWSLQYSPTPIFLNQLEAPRQWKADHIQLRQMTYDAGLASAHSEKGGWHPEDVKAHFEDRLDYDLAVYDKINWAVGVSLQSQLATIAARMLLVIGEAELGSIVSEDVAKTAVSIVKQGQYQQITGVGHGIHREKFEAFRDIVVPFFKNAL